MALLMPKCVNKIWNDSRIFVSALKTHKILLSQQSENNFFVNLNSTKNRYINLQKLKHEAHESHCQGWINDTW